MSTTSEELAAAREAFKAVQAAAAQALAQTADDEGEEPPEEPEPAQVEAEPEPPRPVADPELVGEFFSPTARPADVKTSEALPHAFVVFTGNRLLVHADDAATAAREVFEHCGHVFRAWGFAHVADDSETGAFERAAFEHAIANGLPLLPVFGRTSTQPATAKALAEDVKAKAYRAGPATKDERTALLAGLHAWHSAVDRHKGQAAVLTSYGKTV